MRANAPTATTPTTCAATLNGYDSLDDCLNGARGLPPGELCNVSPYPTCENIFGNQLFLAEDGRQLVSVTFVGAAFLMMLSVVVGRASRGLGLCRNDD
jgi:hypothetical protein